MTSPIHTVETGIFYFFKYTNKASREPKVEAATPTPSVFNLILFFTFLISSYSREMQSYFSLSFEYLYIEEPASDFSSPLQTNLSPIDPYTY